MELLAAHLYIFVGGLDLLVLQEGVLPAGYVYLYQVLVNDASGAKVHMSHLRVSHLSVRKAYIFSAGLQM